MHHRNPNESPIVLTLRAMDFIDHIAGRKMDMPAPYLTFSTHDRYVSVGVQCRSTTAFEQWREALGISVDEITMDPGGFIISDEWIDRFKDEWGVRVQLYMGTGLKPRPTEEPRGMQAHLSIPRQPNGQDR